MCVLSFDTLLPLSTIKLRNSGLGFRGGMSQTDDLFPRNLRGVCVLSDTAQSDLPTLLGCLEGNSRPLKCKISGLFLSNSSLISLRHFALLIKPSSRLFPHSVLISLWSSYRFDRFCSYHNSSSSSCFADVRVP